MKYKVTVMEHDRHTPDTWHVFTGLTLKKAWRICERHARRGVKLYGGEVKKHEWGMRGGHFPSAYRSATIRVDPW